MSHSKQRRRIKPKRSPVGAPPGTLIADPSAPRPALRLIGISEHETRSFDNVSLDVVRRCRADWPLVWVDCIGLGDVDLIRDLGTLFSLHPLALEDTVNTSQRPKVDFYDDHAFVVMSMIDDPAEHRFEQISLFFGDNFVVTFQEREGDPFDAVRKRIAAPPPSRLRTRRADYLAYALIDAIVDSYFAPVEVLSEGIEAMEDRMMDDPRKDQLGGLYRLRREAMAMKRALWPLRDALAALARADVHYLRRETVIYVNDTLDHVVRLIDLLETNRELLGELLGMHTSLSQARVGEIVSMLTIVSTIFIPLTFLVGVWGMNFDTSASSWNMPELEWAYGYPAALVFMFLIAVGLLAYFRWRRWL